ncbi:MAG: MFS transporter [Gammaproteobacteria bacterium]|nr:MAG: MFS transporter [Gammaproteobacteria bacterium]
MQTQKLSVREKIGFGVGDMALNVVISAMMLIITFYYTDIFGLTPMDMGILFFSVKIIGAISDLVMGQITDKFTFLSGRYRPWLLWLAVPYGVSVFFVFTTPHWAYDAKLIWAYSTYIMMTLITSGVGIPYISLPSAITSDPKDRLSANGYRLFLAKIGAFMVAIVVPIVAGLWTDRAVGYQIAMAIMSAVGVIMFLFCYFNTSERVVHVVERQSLVKQFAQLLKNDQWLILVAVCVTGTIGYVIRGSVAIYYAKYYLGGDEKVVSAFLSTGVAAAILSMIASTWITKFYCKIKLFRYTQLIVGVLSVMIYFLVGRNDVVLAFALYFLLSFVVDLHAPVFWSIISETIDYGQVKNGKRVSGFAYGGISVGQKAGMGIAGLLVGSLLTYFQYVPNQTQSDFSLMGIALMLSIIPGFFHAVMGLLMFKYRINDSYYGEIKDEMKLKGYIAN